MKEKELQLGVIVAPVPERCFGLTFGWDAPVSLLKPYLTLEVLGWMICLGWVLNPEEFLNPPLGVAEHERQSHALAMRRDYWDKGMRVAVCKTHHPERDEPRPYMMHDLMELAGIGDGDEFEILLTATDRRPQGDRRYLRIPGGYRPETDDECLRRIESHA